MSKLFDEVVAFVGTSFKNENIEHFERTVHWIKQLDPEATEAMEIAAYAHDIERAFRDKSEKRFPNKDELTYHQEQGGKIMDDFLLKKGATEKIAKKVRELISKHEVGGNREQNLLKDADSISYFECNAKRHINWVFERGLTKEQIRKKFDWMFERITSPKAKKTAKPMYEEALQLLKSA